PAEVQAFRQEDDVSGEAVAAEVRRLPDPVVLSLLLQRLVQRPPGAGAAAVVLAVGADDEERVFERLLPAAGHVEVEQVVVVLDLGVEELAVPLGRAAPVHRQGWMVAAMRSPDEQKLAARLRVAL